MERLSRTRKIQSGIPFEGFRPGDRFVTGRRTVHETEVNQFIHMVGLFEPLFVDDEYIRDETVFGEPISPGSLTFGMAEGLTVLTGIIHGTAMAFVGLERMRLFAPVKLGDTIQVEIEVLDTKEVKSRGGGIVLFRQWVRNQRGEIVMEYDVSRLIRSRKKKDRKEKSERRRAQKI